MEGVGIHLINQVKFVLSDLKYLSIHFFIPICTDFFFQLMLICSSSLYYSSTSCSRSSFTPLLRIFYLYALFFQITYSAGYLVVINQPHSPHSFQRGSTPDRNALFSFPIAGKIELLQMQVDSRARTWRYRVKTAVPALLVGAFPHAG